MANNYQEGIDKAKQDIDELQGKLIAMQNSILENAKQFNAMLGKGSGSMKQTLETVSKVTKEFDKLNETKKQSIVVDGQIKVKQSELAKSMQALNEQRKKANSERLKEADAIERNKQALQKQKKASIELSRAYVQLVNQQKQAKKTLQDLIVSQGKNSAQTRKAQKEYDTLTKKVNQANKATSNFSKTGLGSMVSGFRNLIGAFGVIGGLQLFADLTKKGFDLARQLDSLNFTMKSVISSEEVLSRTQLFLSETAEKYGASILKLTERYNKFYTAAKQSGVTLEDTEAIFKSFTKSAGFLGLRSHELEGVFLALEQMLSKGKVTTEELRRQLGERLPGAFGVMADTVNKLNPDIEVTVAVLDEMLKKGEILSAEVLPEFAKQYEKSIGITQKNRVETLNASIERMTNSWVKFIGDVTNSEGVISKVLIMAIDLVTDFVDTLNLMNQTQDAFNKTLENKSFVNQIKYYKELGVQAEIYAKIDVKKTKEAIKNKKQELELNKQIIKSFENRDWAEHERLAKENNISLSEARDNVIDYAHELSTLNGRLRAAELTTKDVSKSTNDETEKRRTLKDVMKDISDLQSQLSKSTKEEAIDILRKISVLNKEKEAWENIDKIKRKKVDLLGLDKIDPKKEVKKAQELLDTIIKHINKEDNFDLTVAPELDFELSEETKKAIKDYTDKMAKEFKKSENLKTLKDVFNEVTDTFSDIFDIDTSKFDFLFDGLENTVSEWAELSKELIGSVLDATLNTYDVQLQEAQRVRDITLNNDLASEEAKENARKKYDEKERKIKTEKAKQEREIALYKIALDTATAIAKSVAASPLTGGLPFSAIALGIGLAQASIVNSQPLPQFFDGVENSNYEGLATKDERGAELHLDKYGNIKDFGQDRGAKYTYVEKGDTIIPAMKTKDILSSFSDEDINRVVFEMNMSSMGSALSETSVDNSLLREVGGLRSDIDKMGKRIEKLASRPLNINNKIELKDDRAY